MKTTLLPLLVASAFVASAASAEIGAEGRLRCALASAAECDEAAACDGVTLAQIEVPGALSIDFDAKQLSSSDGKRTSPIGAVEVLEAALVVQGHQNGRGWTIVIDRRTGHLVASLVDVEGSFALSGGCSTE